MSTVTKTTTKPRTNTAVKGRFARTNGRLAGSWWVTADRNQWGTRVNREATRMQTSDFSTPREYRQGGVMGS